MKILNHAISQFDLIDIYSTSIQWTVQSSCAQGTPTKIIHILVHQTNFNKLKIIPIFQSMFSDHSGFKCEINIRRVPGKSPNIWKLIQVQDRVKNSCLFWRNGTFLC